MVTAGIISVVIEGHFGGGDHFDGGDHFGGGTGVRRLIIFWTAGKDHCYLLLLSSVTTISFSVYAQKVGNLAPGGPCPHPFPLKMSPYFRNKFLMEYKK